MARNLPKERRIDIYKAILELRDLQECCDFFEDICAVTELRSMEQRYEVAKMLYENNVYTEIMQKTKASSATISRVNRMLNYGTGCLSKIFDRLAEKEAAKEAEADPDK